MAKDETIKSEPDSRIFLGASELFSGDELDYLRTARPFNLRTSEVMMTKKNLGIMSPFKGKGKAANGNFEIKGKNIVSKERVGRNVLIFDNKGKSGIGPSYGRE